MGLVRLDAIEHKITYLLNHLLICSLSISQNQTIKRNGAMAFLIAFLHCLSKLPTSCQASSLLLVLVQHLSNRLDPLPATSP